MNKKLKITLIGDSKNFKYSCGCFMVLSGNSGGGKQCDKCKEQQKKDTENYLGFKYITCGNKSEK